MELDTELRIPKGSSAELVSELMGGVRMNILLANNPREKYAVGDTIPGTLNNGMMESAAKLIPKVEEMLPKLDSILISLNNILGDKSIPATLHSIEKTTANLAVVSSQVKGLMSNDIPQLTSKLNTIGDNFVVISGNLFLLFLNSAIASLTFIFSPFRKCNCRSGTGHGTADSQRK